MIQQTVWTLTLIGMGFVTVIFVYVFFSASSAGDASTVKARWYGIRPWWFALLVVLAAVALAATLSALPYADTHGRAESGADLTVQMTAHQWYWEIDQTELPVGQEIAFHVRSGDVNHSFGLYDSDGRLLVQTQAMPGYTNIVRHRFEQSGRYRVMCLEYCGLAHHVMMAELNVVAAQ